MSTLTLVAIAVFTALSAVGALWFMRWQEQKRLERARMAVEQADKMGELSLIGETLGTWLSPRCMQFLSARIKHHFSLFQSLGLNSDQRSARAMENAMQWAQATKITPKPKRLPAQSKQAQDFRNLLTLLIDYIRTEYQKHQIRAEDARPLLSEARTLNVKIAVTVFDSKAQGATSMGNHSQAVHYLKKAITAVESMKNPPAEITELLDDLKTRHQQQLNELQTGSVGTRLASMAEKLAEDDESWKKKNF